jgi:hypothetical protein
MNNLEKDFPLIKYVISNQAQDYDQDENTSVIHKNVPQLEDCAICQEQMVTARKLSCGHNFHQFCIIQLIQSGSKNCPMCR